MPTQQQKRGLAAALSAVNPTPLAGEIVWVSDNNTLVVGNGSSAYSSLSVISATPTSHTHGNITNAGAIGSTANLPVITTTSGVLTTGTFGTSANTFCAGNDARLSDARTPTGAAGGYLTGTYPNPTIAAGAIVTADLANDAVTYAKIQNVSATDRLLGRSSAGAGDVEEITCTSFARTLIDDADAATARTTLSVQPTASPAFTGAATFENTGDVVPVTITNAGTANSFVVNDASGDTTPFVIDAAGNVGIQSTSASYSLQIQRDAAGIPADSYVAVWGNVSGSNGTTGGVRFFNRQGNADATPSKQIAGVYAGRHGDNFGGSLTFLTANASTGTQTLATRLTIDSTGTATFSGQIVGQAGAAFTGNATITASSGIPLTLNGNSTALRIEEGAGETIDIYRLAADGLLYFDANQQTFSGFVFRTTPTGGSITTRLTISSTGTATFSGQIVGQAGAAFTGAATFDNTGNVVPLTITNAGTANSFVVNDASGDTTPFVIDASGRVGIGTGSPGAELEVADSSSDNDVRINLRPNGSTLSQVGASSTTTFIDSIGARSITFLTDATTRLTISSTGTATFSGQIIGQAGAAFTGAATFENTGNVVPLTVTNAGTANSFVVNDASGDTTPFVITSSGNVGVGVSTPGVKLEVATASPSELGAVARFYHGPASDRSVEVGVYGTTPFRPYIQARTSGSTANELHIQPDGGAAVMGAQLLVTAGSVSTCSVAPSGDPNTGLYFPSADVAAVVTNGTERVRVGSGGRVQFFAADEKFGIHINKGSAGNGPFIGSDGADILTISTAGGAERVRVKATGSVRFVPLAADPASGNEAGDVYYNSSTNKLRVYNGTSWVDLH